MDENMHENGWKGLNMFLIQTRSKFNDCVLRGPHKNLLQLPTNPIPTAKLPSVTPHCPLRGTASRWSSWNESWMMLDARSQHRNSDECCRVVLSKNRWPIMIFPMILVPFFKLFDETIWNPIEGDLWQDSQLQPHPAAKLPSPYLLSRGQIPSQWRRTLAKKVAKIV